MKKPGSERNARPNKVEMIGSELSGEKTARERNHVESWVSAGGYEAVVDNLGMGVSVITQDMRIVTLNKQMQRWFPEIDVSTRPLCYRSFNTPPRDEICSYCPTSRTLKDGRFHEAVTETPTPEGLRNFRIVSTPVTDKAGCVVAAIEVVEDITEKRRLETALRKSEEKYRMLVETAGEAIFTVDRDGVFLFMNNEAAGAMGGVPADFVGKMMWDLFPKEIADAHMETIREAIASGRRHVAENPTPVRRGRRWYRTSVQPVGTQEGGGPPAALLIAWDITDRKSLEEQLIRSERLAAVGTLASGVAHEFNNINVSILGFCELALERSDLDDQLSNWLDRIRQGSRRAATITDKLLTFSWSHRRQMAPGDLVNVIKETLDLLDPELCTGGVELELNLDPVPRTLMDARPIGQVILNLLINALHSLLGRPEKRITVETGRSGDRVFARITDTGCGIPVADLSKIFTPFFSTKGEHAEGTPQAAVKGAGLGLSVSNTIAQNHKGEITVQSEDGIGTSSTLWLPVEPP